MRLHRLLLAIIMVAIVAGTVRADEPHVTGFDMPAYESALASAERSVTPSSWLTSARYGVESAIARWERDAACLYDNPEYMAVARDQLRCWSADDIATRFASWLLDRFFGREAARVRGLVESAVATANLQFLYSVAADGSVVRDAAGDPVVARTDDPAFDADAWRSRTEGGIASALAAYDARLESLRPELLAYIEPDERDRFESIVTESRGIAHARAALELNALADREERLFVARRTTDMWSLRHKSEGEAAGEIAAELTRTTARACESGIAALQGRIEAAGADANELEFAGTAWLAAFREQFDRGLAAWNDAEERFMVRRLEWERDASRAYAAGNQAWADAFEQLEAGRRTWEEQASSAYRDGEIAFTGASATLEASIRSAKAEYQRLTSERVAMSADRANAWVDVYVQCNESMHGEYANASYWLSELGPEAPRIGDDMLAGWLAAESGRPENDTTRRMALECASSSIALYDHYRQQAVEAETRLVAEFDVNLGTLDAYQIELARAGAIASYWRRRTDIAHAVLDYADDASSGRATESELMASLQRVSDAYDQALSAYDAARQELSDASASIGDARRYCDAAQAALAQAGARLEEVNGRYASLMAVLLTDDSSFLQTELVARYQELVAQEGNRQDLDAPSEAEVLANYLTAARRCGAATAIRDTGDALRLVIAGSVTEPSLAELRRSAAAIIVPADDDSPAADPATYGLTTTDSAYAQIESLHHDLLECLSLASGVDGAAGIQSRYAAMAARIINAARERAQAALDERLDAVALLGAPTLSSWYEHRAGHAADGDVIAALAADAASAWCGLVCARARLELAALDISANRESLLPVDQRAADLATWWAGDQIAIEHARATLCAILACDDASSSGESCAASLQSLGMRDERVAAFMRGIGFFSDGGIDRASLLCGQESRTWQRAVGRQTALARFGGLALAAESERYASSVAALDAGLGALGLARGSDGSLPMVEDIGRAVFTPGNGANERIAAMMLAIDGALTTAPAWMRGILSGWRQSVNMYLAAGALALGAGAPVSTTELSTRIEYNRQASAELQRLLETPCDDGAAAIGRLSLLATERGMALVDEAASLQAALGYAMAYEQLRDEAAAAASSGTVQWRQYLASAATAAVCGAQVSACASWIEGSLADCQELAARASVALGAALGMWGSSSVCDASEFSSLFAITEKYITNPDASFDAGDIGQVAPSLEEAEAGAYAAYARLCTTRSQARNAFAAAAGAYELAADRDSLQDRVRIAAQDVASARTAYDRAMADYALAGGVLAAAGGAYDAAYARVASLDRTQESARTEYEKFDAIRRWASTSYLAVTEPADAEAIAYRSPSAEAIYAETGLARASAALAALEHLHDDASGNAAAIDPAFSALYERYRASYSNLMLAAKARDILGTSIQNEMVINARAYDACTRSIAALQRGVPSESWYPYLRLGDDGLLRLAHGSDFEVSGAATADAIDGYFSEAYGRNIEELAAWMSATGFDERRARSWGLARDYVLSSMAARSAGFASMASSPDGAVDEAQLGGHRFTLLGQTISDILADYRSGELSHERRAAYERMGDVERGWFETYLALQVVGAMRKPVGADGSGAETFDAFSYWSTRAEYQRLESVAVSELHVCEIGTKASAASYAGFIAAAAVAGAFFFTAWLVPPLLAAAGVAYAAIIGFSLNAADINATRSVYTAEMNDVQRQTSLNVAMMTEGMDAIVATRAAYQDSCVRLAQLTADGEQTESVDAAMLADSLARTGRLSAPEVSSIVDLYAEYQEATGAEHRRADEALVALSDWTRVETRKASLEMDGAYSCDAARQLEASAAYRSVYDGFVAGQASTQELLSCADAAFGAGTLSASGYDAALASACADIGLEGVLGDGPIPCRERAEAAASLAGLAAQACSDRYEAELAAREVEWDVRRFELSEKLNAWREAAGLILTRGRADFASGTEMLQERYASWASGFSETYANRQTVWNLTCGDMQAEKLAWVARATDAADRAAADAMLAMVGSDAEAATRRYDICTVLDLTSDTDADTALDHAMEMAGINSMADVLAIQSGVVRTLSPVAMKGLAAQTSTESGLIQAAARAFVDKASAELAGTQSRIMAARARISAEGAIAALARNVDRANDDISQAMNVNFVSRGRWQRQAGSYMKDVVVHSTLLQNYITEKASVAVDEPFVPRLGDLRTDMSDRTLAVLDTGGIQALLEAALREVSQRHDYIFGSPDQTSETASVSGAFGAWVGRDPRLAEGADPDSDSEAMFADQGAGELGRLMRNFLLWSLREDRGWMEANKPSYEKDLWDDRGAWFKAPSIRGMADIGFGIAASVMSGGVALPALLGATALNLADDAVFGALDVAGGYRSAQDAGLAFIKKSAMAGVSVLGGGVFNGFGRTSGGFFGSGFSGALSGASGLAEVAGRTTLLGLQGASIGLANAAIGAVSWNGSTLGWSGASFSAGIKGSLVAAATGMAGGLTRGLLDQGLEGFTGVVYDNGIALSGLGGSLAAQGVQYALTGMAAFNVANLTMLGLAGSDGVAVPMGLLALRLGPDGLSAGLGSDGSDISLGTVSRAAMGLEAWAVNARMAISGQEEATRYASALRTLYSTGDSASAERTLYGRILAGQTDIVEDRSGDYSARTSYDLTTGHAIISLGSGSLADTSRFGIGIVLTHEAYRDGIDNGQRGQQQETVRAILGHIGAAASLEATYGSGAMSATQRAEVAAMRVAYAGSGESLASVLDSYDTSGDFWRLNHDGSLAFDGRATLRDEDGTIIWSAADMGVKESQIEGSLLKILGVDQGSAANIEAVRQLMVDAGMQHSFAYDSDQWLWVRRQSVAVGASGSFPVTRSIDLTVANQGTSISIDSISGFYGSIDASEKIVQGFIGTTYGSAIGLLEYAGDQYKAQAERLLARVYTRNEVKMIESNKTWYDDSIRSGIAVDSMITGNASRTTGFGVDTGNLALATSSVPGAAFFQEWHTGLDYGSGGSSVQTPGGAWQFEWQDDHRAYFQLFGGDLKMRIMHLDPTQVMKLNPGQLFGYGSQGRELLSYPSQSFGTGTGAHIHIDFTRRLPYDGCYERQFVNPETFQPSSMFDYSFSYLDSSNLPLIGYPQKFYRY